MRGQLFSLDFVISFAIVVLTIGITLQTVDLMQRKANNLEALQSNNAETIAESLALGVINFEFITPVPYSVTYTNGSADYSYGWSGTCRKNTYVARRMTTCLKAPSGVQPRPCFLEVRTCE